MAAMEQRPSAPGAEHLTNLTRLETAGKLQLVAVVDPKPPTADRRSANVQIFADLPELLAAAVAPDVVIIATPIHTHAALGVAALAAGVDVYIQKPTAASMSQFQELRAAAEATGGAVQVGFQSLGSLALPALAELISAGGLGTVGSCCATGAWLRTKAYYQRSSWAGKRTMKRVDVVDGVTTNPLAHAVATALHIARIHSRDAIESVETDLYRAHDIEGDDTSTVRITPRVGPTIVSAFTLCAPAQREPFVSVHGTAGSAIFYYTTDVLEITTESGTTRQDFARSDLLENLIAYRANGTPLLSSLENGGAFMRVLEAVRTAEAPQIIPAKYINWVGEGQDAHPVIADIEAWIGRARSAQATFAELGAPWARHHDN